MGQFEVMMWKSKRVRGKSESSGKKARKIKRTISGGHASIQRIFTPSPVQPTRLIAHSNNPERDKRDERRGKRGEDGA